MRAPLYYSLDVPTCQQINHYFCGPATVQQTIKYLTGKEGSQEQYANELGTSKEGTDMTQIAPVLTTHTGRGYVMSSIGDYTNWCNIIANI